MESSSYVVVVCLSTVVVLVVMIGVLDRLVKQHIDGQFLRRLIHRRYPAARRLSASPTETVWLYLLGDDMPENWVPVRRTLAHADYMAERQGTKI
jgi:hypothetical protein